MSAWGIILRNLLHFRRQHLGVALGAALCAMVLMGALTVGDSVRATLAALAEERIGKADLALLAPDGFFREELADEVADGLEEKAIVAPVVLTRGTVSLPDGKLRVNNVQVLGVDERFWALSPSPSDAPDWTGEGFYLNERLGKRIGLEPGERLVLRVEEPGLFSRDAPLSGERDNKFVSFNEELGGFVPAGGFGHFGIQGNQREPLTIFVPIKTLQKKMFRSFEETGKVGYSNFLLLGAPGPGELSLAAATTSLEESWSLEDAGIHFKKMRDSAQWSVRTRQVFLSETLQQTVKSLHPESSGVLTYLVNAIERAGQDDNGSLLTPYSMVTALDPSSVDFIPSDLRPDEIVLNEWAASDLNASPGDRIKLTYYTVGERRKLTEEDRLFTVRSVSPMPPKVPEGEQSDWTPQFPGLSDAESCGEWDTGIPITHKVRDKDEIYWNDHRGSPKAFVAIDAGREMWQNRWGSLTGMRIPRDAVTREEAVSSLRSNLSPAEAGLIFQPLRANAREGVESPVDFGELFLAFSFFVILAALALVGMLFSFSMEQRTQQAGLLLALGWRVRKVRVTFLSEGILVAVAGSLAGVLLALAYGRAILLLLGGEWSGAVSGASFRYEPSATSLLTGGVGAVFMATLAMAWSTRKQFRREPRDLLSDAAMVSRTPAGSRKNGRTHSFLAIVLALCAGGLAFATGLSATGASMSFFGAGALLLASGLFYFRDRLGRFAAGDEALMKAQDLGRRNLGRRVGRSLVTVGAMAAGTFLVVSTGAFRKHPPQSPDDPLSGTGGFTYLGESALPLYDDLNGAEGQELYDLNRSLLESSLIVPLRVREGDDASCLNLNKAILPRIYGVKPSEFAGRFSFAEGNWSALRDSSEGAVPALVDQNTMMWALKKGLGDRLEFRDGQGRPFEVELRAVVKGSILQGAIYLDEEAFLEKFPQQGGYRAFFIAQGAGLGDQVVSHLERKLERYGMEFRPTLDRLQDLQRVENTYLSIFQGLGGLGLLLGTAGLAVVIARNVMERAREFALLEAVGYRLGLLRKMVFSEHLMLGLWGLAVGVVSAGVGIAPALFGKAGRMPGPGFLWFFLALLMLSLFWTWLSVRLTLRPGRLDELRNE